MSTIKAIITADPSGFISASSRVSSSAAKMGGAIRSSSTQFQSWAKIGAAAAIAVGSAVVRGQLKSIDSMAKTSDALGVQIGKFQALTQMADLNGVSSEQLAKSMQKMGKNMGDAARKGGAAADALNDVGINIDDVIKQSPDKQLESLGVAIAGVENQSLKASIASDIFGRDGLRMLKVLNQLEKDGLQPTIDDINSMGASLSRVDAASVEAANDAITKARAAIGGVVTKITVKLAPIIQMVADKFTQLARDTGGFKAVIDSTFSGAIKIVGVFANGLHGINIIAKSLEAGFYGFAIVVNSVMATVSTVVEGFINGAISSVNLLISAFNSIPMMTNLPLLAMVDQASTYFDEAADMWSSKLAEASDELMLKMMSPLPSEQVKIWADNIISETARVAEATSEIEQSSELQKLSWAKMTRDQKIKYSQDTFKGLASLMQTENKRLFKIGQAAAISDALVNAYKGISTTFNTYAYPYNIPMAAAHAATAFAQISSIKNQKFGGGGAASAPSVGSSSAASTSSAAPTSQQPVSRNVSVTLVGDNFGQGGIRGLISQINQELGDGMTLGAN